MIFAIDNIYESHFFLDKRYVLMVLLIQGLLTSVVDGMNTNGLTKGFYYWNYYFLLVCLLLRRN